MAFDSEIGNLFVRVSADTSGLVSGMHTAAGAITTLSNSGATAMQRIGAAGALMSKTGGAIMKNFSVPLAAAATMSVKAAMNYETAFTKVRKTVKATDEELDALSDNIRGMAKEIPVSAAELAELAGTGGQLGIAVENIEEFTRVMADMGVATNLAGEEGASEMAKFVNIMGTSQKQFSNIGSSIVHLGNNMATTEADIMAMSLRLASTGNIVGMTEDEVLACAAAMSSVGIEAEAGGTAMSRTWTDIHTAVVQGGKALQEYARISGKSAEEFSAQWKEDAAGAFVDLIRGLGQSENMLEELSKIGVDEVRQKNMLQSLAKAEAQSGLLAKALELSNTAWDENVALTNEAETAYSTTANQLQLAKNDITEAGIAWGEMLTPYVRDAAGWIRDFTEDVAEMGDGTKNSFIETAAGVTTLGLALTAAGKAASAISGIIGLGTTLAPILAANPLALAAVGGLATWAAVGIGRAAYDKHMKAYADEAKEAAASLEEVRKKQEEINAYGWEFKQLNLELSDEDISEERKEEIVARMEELAEWFDKEYNVKLTVSGAEEVIEANQAVIDSRAALKDAELRASFDNSLMTARQGKERFEADKAPLKNLKATNEGLEENNRIIAKAIGPLEQYKRAWEEFDNAAGDGDGVDATEYSRILEYLPEEAQNRLENLPKTAASIYEVIRNLARDTVYTLPDIYDQYKDDFSDPMDLSNAAGEFAKAKKDLDDVISRLFKDYSDNTETISENQNLIDEIIERNEEYVNSINAIIGTGQEMLRDAVQNGDSSEAQRILDDIKTAAQLAGTDLVNISADTAAALTNFGTFEETAAAGGDALNAMVTHAIELMQQWGESGEKAALAGALVKNGLKNVEDINPENVEAVNRDLQELAQSMGILQDGQTITINADGDISIIEEATGDIEKLQLNSGVTIAVSATGDLTVLNEATGKTQTLQDIGAVTLQVNADGNIDALNAAGEKVAEIDAETADVTITKNSEEVDNYQPEDKSSTVVYEPDDSAVREYVPPLKYGQVFYQEVMPDVAKEATGTSYFRGGLALVNDQRGIADPRELIIDRGQAFIPEGRDVLLPLSKGAKVFTASQTKEILARAGVPAFANGVNVGSYWRDKPNGGRTRVKGYTRAAGGIDNEILDEFDEFYDTLQFNLEMDWINEDEYMRQLAEFRDANLTASGDTLEAWRTVTSELKQYEDETRADAISGLDEWRSEVADWNSYNVDMGRWSSEEQLAIMKNQDAEMLDMLNSTIAANNFTEDELKEIWAGYYDWKRDQEVDQYNLEKQLRRDALEEANALSEKYLADTSYFNTWSALGDTPIDAYWRYASRNQNALAAGDLTQEEYNDLMENIGSSMYSERLSDSKRWLSEQEKYYGMNTNAYLAGLDRMREYTEEYYQKGIISAREYFDSMADIEGMYFDKVSGDYDDKLSDFREQISELESYYSGVISDMQTDWNTQDRTEDMALIKTDMSEFAGAVTSAGRAEYERLADELKALEREEEIYQLQVKQEAILDELNQKYDFAEKEKAEALSDIAQNGFDITARMNNILSGLTAMTESIDNYVSNVENSSNVVYNITAADGVDLRYILKQGGLRL